MIFDAAEFGNILENVEHTFSPDLIIKDPQCICNKTTVDQEINNSLRITMRWKDRVSPVNSKIHQDILLLTI